MLTWIILILVAVLLIILSLDFVFKRRQNKNRPTLSLIFALLAFLIVATVFTYVLTMNKGASMGEESHPSTFKESL